MTTTGGTHIKADSILLASVRVARPKTSVGLLIRNAASRLLDAPLVGDIMATRMFADRFAMPDYG
jgi:hypothetical protein